MGIFFFILIIGLLLLTISNGFLSASKTYNTSACKPHKWVQKPVPDERGYLICAKCNKEPGAMDDGY